MLIQFTGLSGAGKSTIAQQIKDTFWPPKTAIHIIDGDEYRKSVCKDLGFSKEDRIENIRRLGRIANDLNNENNIIIIAAINPFNEIRRELETSYQAFTVYIKCDLPTLIGRDTKGLYHRALLPSTDPDSLSCLTGVNDIFEIPANPHLILDTTVEPIQVSVQKLITFIEKKLGRVQKHVKYF